MSTLDDEATYRRGKSLDRESGSKNTNDGSTSDPAYLISSPPSNGDSAGGRRLSSHSSNHRSPLATSQSMPTSGQRQSRPGQNEETPIFSGSDDPLRRDYQSTGGVATGVANGRGKDFSQTAAGRSGNTADPDEETTRSCFGRLMDKYGTLELDNKGSVARDHLALERTFLAWLRTSLGFASIGIAVTQLFRLNSTTTNATSLNGSGQFPPLVMPHEYDAAMMAAASKSSRLRALGKPLGATFIGVSIIVLLIGFHRYFESQYWIVRGKFPASRGSVTLIAFMATALIITALTVILAVSPDASEL